MRKKWTHAAFWTRCGCIDAQPTREARASRDDGPRLSEARRACSSRVRVHPAAGAPRELREQDSWLDLLDEGMKMRKPTTFSRVSQASFKDVFDVLPIDGCLLATQPGSEFRDYKLRGPLSPHYLAEVVLPEADTRRADSRRLFTSWRLENEQRQVSFSRHLGSHRWSHH